MFLIGDSESPGCGEDSLAFLVSEHNSGSMWSGALKRMIPRGEYEPFYPALSLTGPDQVRDDYSIQGKGGCPRPRRRGCLLQTPPRALRRWSVRATAADGSATASAAVAMCSQVTGCAIVTRMWLISYCLWLKTGGVRFGCNGVEMFPCEYHISTPLQQNS